MLQELNIILKSINTTLSNTNEYKQRILAEIKEKILKVLECTSEKDCNIDERITELVHFTLECMKDSAFKAKQITLFGAISRCEDISKRILNLIVKQQFLLHVEIISERFGPKSSQAVNLKLVQTSMQQSDFEQAITKLGEIYVSKDNKDRLLNQESFFCITGYLRKRLNSKIIIDPNTILVASDKKYENKSQVDYFHLLDSNLDPKIFPTVLHFILDKQNEVLFSKEPILLPHNEGVYLAGEMKFEVNNRRLAVTNITVRSPYYTCTEALLPTLKKWLQQQELQVKEPVIKLAPKI